MNTYKKLLKYTPEKMHCAYISIFFSAVSVFLQIAAYWFLWKFLHALIVEKKIQDGKFYAITIVALLIANLLIGFFAVWASHILGFRLETNLRKAATDHLMKASFAFFDMNPSGKIRKLIDDNAAETHMIVAHLIPDNVAALLTPILMFILVFMVDVQLGILLLIVALIGGLQMKLMMGDKSFMEQYMLALERLNAEAVEYVRGMQVVKIFRGTVESFKAFYEAITAYAKLALNYSNSCRTPYVSFQVLFNLFTLFTVPVAIVYINRGAGIELILAKIIFYVCFAGILFASFMRVMYVGMYNFQAAQVVDKLENLFTEMQKDNLTHGTVEKFDNFDIEFKNVSFAYGEENVLNNVSFKLEGKKNYALVGSSGGGKSTIAKLISGFYKINDGAIFIGGKNISEYSQKALMENIAFVFQNAKLFKTSIFENVKMGNKNASDAEVMEALKQARCDDILDKFKEREHTVIGSQGVHLSGGETQRIAIARAILKNANIIILDEASAAADPENEYEIQQAFSNLMKDKTVIMIAHRLSSIRNVDEILVVDEGSIVERGSDAELMAQDTRYKKLQNLFLEANNWRVYDN
ncbi:ABC transporter ATP-binding protein [Treponema phagedenis]|uniref:ABC transporter ATP-binding protein n=1 Tax=Treponema phagedenis TaxID=162 RepID=A0AAE6IRS6_TREPH|nr:ABC transporter ATP-binding protein [Treponema phagedenis]QEJ94005.1 ABC transporter ATP-binding protein [Treponema phagedenis]QEJ97059.1 ABC transporter ATP-binding protein [Treponema phagedenis]QEK02969.1 ABC transporter ATP-binding protein [Treponema phagedenis]QEK08598.1 ABC transporter ATP-binding protein [Treponema phagedenis]